VPKRRGLPYRCSGNRSSSGLRGQGYLDRANTGEFLSPNLPRADQVLERESIRTSLKTVLDQLTPHEELIIRSRFGLDHPLQALEDIAKKLGVPLAQARQTEVEALTKLRVLMDKSGYG